MTSDANRDLRTVTVPVVRKGGVMTNALGTAYRVWAGILFLAVIVQVGAAGYGAFYAFEKAKSSNALTKKQFDHGFNVHIALGYLLLIASLLLFLFAVGARLERRRVLLALAVPLLVVLAIGLAAVGEKTPGVGVLHPIDAFLIMGLTGYLAHNAWASHRLAKPS